MIESYRFGKIVINGKSYSSDVIIIGDHVKANWWRREGHRLHIEAVSYTHLTLPTN